MKKTITLCAVMSALLFSSVALAQYAPPPPPPPGPPPGAAPYAAPPPAYAEPQGFERQGFLIGFSIGGGSISADCGPNVDCDVSGVAVSINIGGMLTPRLGLMWDGSAVAHPIDGGGTLTHAINTVAAQYWVSDRFWLKGGLGLGQFSVSDSDGNNVAESERGGAALFGLGYELMQGRTFALDVQLRLAAVSYDTGGGQETFTNTSLNLGFNWY